jgi:TonB-linked SusC/RagA family outer membrane protein
MIVSVFLASVQFSYAQQSKTISGIVTDVFNEPVVGANIYLSKTGNISAMTNIEGKFALNVPADTKQLTVSFIGYVTQNIDVKDKTSINVTLEEDSKLLNEVVVTALGISREAKSLPYARQSISTEGMDESRDVNLLNMLSGKVAGVLFISNGGSLSSTRVVIRGENSLTGNNQPLYVIDGVPIMNDMGDSGDLDYGNTASSINPDDVESIEVLKGANASALYGSDAANGVILITTKKAKKKNGMGISYSINTQLTKLSQFPIYQNVYGAGSNGLHAGFNYQGQSGYDPELPLYLPNFSLTSYNAQSFGYPMLGFEVIGRDGELKTYSPSPETITNMYQIGTQLTNSLSFDKATDGLNLRFSYTNTNFNDILENFNKLNRNAFSLQTTIKLAKFLSTDVGVRYTKDDVSNRGPRSGDRSPLVAIANLPRDASYEELKVWKNDDGTPKTVNGFTNPYWLLNEVSNADTKNVLWANISLNFTLTNYLKLRLRGTTDLQTQKAWDFTNFYSPFNRDGDYSASDRLAINNVFEALVSFNKRFGKFGFSANAGSSNQKLKNEQIYTRVQAMLQPDVKSLANNAGTANTSENRQGKEKIGLFGQANVGYRDFLYVDATARNDWSSTLPAPHSYFYYSGGTSIVISEAFHIPKNILSFGKLRASYAKTGNDTGFDMLRNGYVYGNLYLGNMTWYTGESTSKNPVLKPETTISTEFGVDLRFLNNRLSTDFTYYEKATKDQIVQASISVMSGYDRRVFNRGEIKNHGYELSITGIPIKTKNFEWSITGNWAKNESLVVSLVEGVDRFRLANWNGTSVEVFAEVGQPYGVMYGVDYKRNENGDILVDASGRPKSDTESKYYGKVSPDWLAGITNTFRYKNFDFSFLIDIKEGGILWSYSAYQGSRYGQTVASLFGRDEYLFSNTILGENDTERLGYLEPNRTNNPDSKAVQYLDWERIKGAYMPERRVYDAEVIGLAGQVCTASLKPTNYYSDDVLKSARRYMYDASFVKLRSISIGYNVPRVFLSKTPFTNARVSAVGRNVAVLHQNTPKGLDPEATTNTGNGQGIENGFSLPQAYYGFDIKVSF